jgi:hypothetical protein
MTPLRLLTVFLLFGVLVTDQSAPAATGQHGPAPPAVTSIQTRCGTTEFRLTFIGEPGSGRALGFYNRVVRTGC